MTDITEAEFIARLKDGTEIPLDEYLRKRKKDRNILLDHLTKLSK